MGKTFTLTEEEARTQLKSLGNSANTNKKPRTFTLTEEEVRTQVKPLEKQRYQITVGGETIEGFTQKGIEFIKGYSQGKRYDNYKSFDNTEKKSVERYLEIAKAEENKYISDLEKQKKDIENKLTPLKKEYYDYQKKVAADKRGFKTISYEESSKKIKNYKKQTAALQNDLDKINAQINEYKAQKEQEAVYKKYNINPQEFGMPEFAQWAFEHDFVITMDSGDIEPTYDGLKKIPSPEEEKEASILQNLVNNKYAKEFATEHPWLSSIGTVIAAPIRGVAGAMATVEDAVRTSTGKEINPYSDLHSIGNRTTTIRNTVGEEYASKWFGGAEGKVVGNVGRFTYDTMMSMGDNVMNLLSTKAMVGGLGLSAAKTASLTSGITSGIMASDATANAITINKQKGLSDEKALTLGVATGVVEMLTEKYSIEQIMGEPKTLVKGLLKGFAAEGGEEFTSNVVNKYLDYVISGEQSDIVRAIEEYVADGYSEKDATARALSDSLADDFRAALSGGFSGMGMSGSYHGVNKVKAINLGRNIANGRYTDISLQKVIEKGYSFDKGSQIYKKTEELSDIAVNGNEKKSNYYSKIGELTLDIVSLDKTAFAEVSDSYAYDKAGNRAGVASNNATNFSSALERMSKVPTETKLQIDAIISNSDFVNGRSKVSFDTVAGSVKAITDKISNDYETATKGTLKLDYWDLYIANLKTVLNKEQVSPFSGFARDYADIVAKAIAQNTDTALYRELTGYSDDIGQFIYDTAKNKNAEQISPRVDAVVSRYYKAVTDAYDYIKGTMHSRIYGNKSEVVNQTRRDGGKIVEQSNGILTSKTGDSTINLYDAVVPEISVAIQDTLKPNALASFAGFIEKQVGSADLKKFVPKMIQNYISIGNLGEISKYFADGGARVIDAIENIGGKEYGSKRIIEGRTVRDTSNVEWTNGERAAQNSQGISRETGNAQSTISEGTIRKQIDFVEYNEVQRENYTDDMKALERENKSNYGVETVFFAGRAINKEGMRANGFYVNGTLYLQIDDVQTARSIRDHEITHHFGKSKAYDTFRRAVKSKMPVQQFAKWKEEIRLAYGELLNKLLANEFEKSGGTLTDAELRNIMDSYLEEEMLANLNAETVDFAHEYTEEISAFRREIEIEGNILSAEVSTESKAANKVSEYSKEIDAGEIRYNLSDNENRVFSVMDDLKNKQGVLFNDGRTIKIPNSDMEVLRRTYKAEEHYSNRTDGILDCIACSGNKDTKHYLYVFYKGEDGRVAPIFRLDYKFLNSYIEEVRKISEELGYYKNEFINETQGIRGEYVKIRSKRGNGSSNANAVTDTRGDGRTDRLRTIERGRSSGRITDKSWEDEHSGFGILDEQYKGNRDRNADGDIKYSIHSDGTFPQGSQASEIAMRWAHNEDIETGTQRIFFYNDSAYLVEKFDSMDLGYLIIRRLSNKEMNKLNRYNEFEDGDLKDARDHRKQPRGKGIVSHNKKNQERNVHTERSRNDNLSFDRHNRETGKVQGVDRIQNSGRSFTGEGSRDIERSIENRKDEIDKDVVSENIRDNIRFSFAGPKSLTADLKAYRRAMEMDKAGVDIEDIWKETKWTKGRDGKFKYEISDKKYRFKKNGFVENPQFVKDYVVHTDLFEAYPMLKEVPIIFDENMDSSTEAIYRYSWDEYGAIILNPKFSEKELKKALIHELQHTIQRIEGFASGASVDYWQHKIDNGYELNDDEKSLVWGDNIAEQLYDYTAGEVEARDVEDRMGFTDKEREETFPYSLDDSEPVTFAETSDFFELQSNFKNNEQHNVMWTLKKGMLNKKEIATFYSKISELKNNKYHNYVMSNDGEYIFAIENKMVFTDGDYYYPEISTVITFNTDNETELYYLRKDVYDAENAGYGHRYATQIIATVYGEEFVSVSNLEDSRPNENYTRRKERSHGREIDSRSREDVRFNVSNQSSVMWTMERGILNKKEIAAFYSKISELKNNKYHNYVMSNDGKYIFAIENKMVFTDGDYYYPEISKVLTLNANNETEADTMRRLFYELQEQGNEIEDAVSIVESVYGQEAISQANFEDSRANESYTRGKERSHGREIDSRSRKDVRFNVSNLAENILEELSDEEWDKFYNSLGMLEHGRWFPKDIDGNYIFETEDKLIYTDGDYSNPFVSRVILFEDMTVEDIEYAKEMIWNASKRGKSSKECCEIAQSMLRQGIITERNYKSRKTYRERTYDCGKRGDSSASNSGSRKDVKLSVSTETQDRISEIAKENLFAVAESVTSKLSNQIDKWLKGKMASNEMFEFGLTPVVLKELGADDLPVIMSQSTMAKINGEKHDISLDSIRELPQNLAEPLMVFKSATVSNSYIILTEMEDMNGDAIIAALHLNKTENRLNVNRIASIYGKYNVAKFIAEQTRRGNLKYLDKIKSQKWSTSKGLQLPKLVQSNPDNNSILEKEDIVNKYLMQNNKKKSNNLQNIRFSASTYETELNNQWDEILNKHGSIEPGANPVRDIKVPRKSDKDKYVSKFARTLLESDIMPDNTVDEFKKEVLLHKVSHIPITDKEAKKYALDKIKDLGFDGAIQYWNALADAENVPGKNDVVLGEVLLNQCLTAADVENSMKIAADLAHMATRSGQATQAFSMLKKMSPDGKLYCLEKSIQTLNREVKKQLGKKGEDYKIKLNKELAKQYLCESNEEDRQEILDKIHEDIAMQIPATFTDKWNAWRYLSMLGNPRTHIRNVLGNAIMLPARKLKNFVGALLESGFVKDKDTRTKAVFRDKEAINFARNDFTKVQSIIKGYDGKYDIQFGEINDKRRIFKNRILEGLRKFNVNAMEAEDMWFLKNAYVDTLSRIMTARGITSEYLSNGTREATTVLENIRNYAIKEALEATYRDANLFADFLNKWKKDVDGSNSVIAKVAWYGTVEGLMPFKKTPLNIAKRGVEYSPAYLIKALVWDARQVRQGKATADALINDLAKGLTGTGLLMLGAFLAHLGILSGADDENEKKRKFDEATGFQGYALKINGVTYTIDWLAPASMPLFIGVELINSLKEDGISIQNFTSAGSKILEPLLELSCLQGISGAIETANYNKTNPLSAIFTDAVSSYALQAVPTLSGQIARTVYRTRRTVYVDKNSNFPQTLQMFTQQAAAKIPGASNMLEPRLDAWGREMKYGKNIALSAVSNFLSPGYARKTEDSKVTKELNDLYEKLGDAKVYPVKANKFINIGKEDIERYGGLEKGKINLTGEQYTFYAKKRGQYSLQLVKELINSYEYRHMSDEEKAKATSNCYTDAGAKAKAELIEKYFLSE